ncbi:hypothetical protein B7P34_28160 [Streptosporangium nondiastaticum]|uniref:Uncharacterized protein n=1 Tax=Streptosporangium nondiastaticum TaxID=35764 RepID=A0A9X7JKI8_9ACTN|nr:hypothetical protein B7P34_28160 [Streptosporangium nondiastaticum]
MTSALALRPPLTFARAASAAASAEATAEETADAAALLAAEATADAPDLAADAAEDAAEPAGLFDEHPDSPAPPTMMTSAAETHRLT